MRNYIINFKKVYEWERASRFVETRERDWRELEEFFSKKISVLHKPRGERPLSTIFIAFLLSSYDIMIKNLDHNAKKVSITIIIVLIGVIGVLWYVGHQKNNPDSKIASTDLTVATSTTLGFDLKAYANGRDSIEQIVVDKLVSGVASSSLAGLPTKVISYSATKIIISYNLSSTSLKTYGQQIAKALSPYSNDQTEEITTMLEALEEKNPVKAQSLLTLATTDRQIMANLLKMAVPKTATTVHLNLINSLNQNATLLTDMAKILDNPNLALESANLYRVQKLNFYKALDGINQFFQTNNITFSPEEGSKIFLTI